MKIITATVKGLFITYPHYNIPSIVYKNGLLFTLYDDNFLKFILIDNSYSIIELKYSPKKIIIQNAELIKYEFEHSKNIDEKRLGSWYSYQLGAYRHNEKYKFKCEFAKLLENISVLNT